MSSKQGGNAKPLKQPKYEYEEDRLSQLPDDILINRILVLLPMKEAGRTTILSRRWRSIRPPILELLPEPNHMPTPKWKQGNRKRNRPPKFVLEHEEKHVAIEAVYDYADWVNRVISATSTLPGGGGGGGILTKFSLHMPFTRIKDEDLSGKINSWLKFALGDTGTEELDFCFYAAYYPSCYQFPSIESQWSLFPRMRLLKSLKLRKVNVESKTLEHLLRRCELLERLHLDGICSLDDLKIEITGPVSRLKYIHLLNVSFMWHGSTSFVISASTPDLISLRYHKNVKVTLSGHAPKLTDMTISTSNSEHDFDLRSHPLSCYIPQIQSLHLDICYWTEIMDWLVRIPDLSSLKHLTLTLNYEPNYSMLTLRGIIGLINSASGLQHLTLDLLKFARSKFRVSSDESADLQLQSLRVLEFVNFVGTELERLAVEYMIKGMNSSLDRLTLESRPQVFAVNYPPEDELETWRTCVLKPILPPGAELIVIKGIHDYDNYLFAS